MSVSAGAPPCWAVCLQVEFESVAGGAATAQTADVFVGLHGASHQNSFFMTPGSSAIEIIPYGFDKDYWGDALGHFNAEASECHVGGVGAPLVGWGGNRVSPTSCSLLACFWSPASQDPSTQLLWWNIVICDPQASEPGIYEAAGWADASGYARYR